MSSHRRDPLSFFPGVAEKLGYYVYALRDPRDGAIFYVGKGKGDRAYQHARFAKRVEPTASSATLKLNRIRAIHDDNLEVDVEVIRHGLGEDAAFDVEGAVIDALRLSNSGLTNAIGGQHSERGWQPLEELAAIYGAAPVTVAAAHRVMLVRINRKFRSGTSAEELYETTRKWWVVGRTRKPDWAFAVFHGIVRAVYRIESWEQGVGEVQRRRAFRGARDSAMEDLYLLKDVSGYYRQGQQNPIAYVNC